MKTNHIYPADRSDRHWDGINDRIPAAKAGGRPRSQDMRHIINALLSLVMRGMQWRMLPKDYPTWQTVSQYVRIWRDAGTW